MKQYKFTVLNIAPLLLIQLILGAAIGYSYATVDPAAPKPDFTMVCFKAYQISVDNTFGADSVILYSNTPWQPRWAVAPGAAESRTTDLYQVRYKILIGNPGKDTDPLARFLIDRMLDPHAP